MAEMDSLKRALAAADAAASAYERLVLLVGPAGSGKSTLLREVAGERDWPVVNLSLELSQRLLEVAPGQRAAKVLGAIEAIVTNASGNSGDASALCLDNIELLFEPALQLDPLTLLQSLSKQRTLVVTWPGELTGEPPQQQLTHAAPGHPEYRAYAAQGLTLLSVRRE
jgi:type II secretory pathway predicted ATPase ExeA